MFPTGFQEKHLTNGDYTLAMHGPGKVIHPLSSLPAHEIAKINTGSITKAALAIFALFGIVH